MWYSASTLLLLTLTVSAQNVFDLSGQRPQQSKSDAALLAERNPALHRLNDRVIASAFSGRNEVVCTYCLFQVVAAAYQLGNEVVQRQISDALSSQRLSELSETLLEAAEKEPTLKSLLKGYYQDTVLQCPNGRLSEEQSQRCANIRSFVTKRAKSVDFTRRNTRGAINREVAEATDGKIRELFAQLSPDTQLVFASTLVYSDMWPSRKVADVGEFTPAGARRPVQVDVTRDEEYLPLLDGSQDGVMGVALPYQNLGIQMYVFTTSDRSDIRDRLHQGHYLSLAGASTTYTLVTLPKFSIESKKYSYVDLMEQLGMREMFQGGLGPNDLLKVDQLVHKAVMDTDENGTSAAGAAGIAFVPLSAKPQPFDFRLDKPFVVTLYHVELGVPLFTAYIADPTKK